MGGIHNYLLCCDQRLCPGGFSGFAELYALHKYNASMVFGAGRHDHFQYYDQCMRTNIIDRNWNSDSRHNERTHDYCQCCGQRMREVFFVIGWDNGSDQSGGKHNYLLCCDQCLCTGGFLGFAEPYALLTHTASMAFVSSRHDHFQCCEQRMRRDIFDRNWKNDSRHNERTHDYCQCCDQRMREVFFAKRWDNCSDLSGGKTSYLLCCDQCLCTCGVLGFAEPYALHTHTVSMAFVSDRHDHFQCYDQRMRIIKYF